MIIAQISDTHIVPKGQHWKSLPETNVADRLRLIVENINHLNPKPDIVIHTGDAIDDGGHEGYEHLKELLEPLTMPYYIIPGNHDDRKAMREAFQHTSYMPSQGLINYVVDDYDIRMVALDSVIPEAPEGLLVETHVSWLQQVLNQDKMKPTLVFMHHPLIKSGQKLLDKVRCYVPDHFESFIASYPNIIGILSGHYHKSCAAIYGKTLCFVGPSSAPVHYFEKASDDDTRVLELVRPSFVLHKWLDGKHLVSEVVQTLQPENRLIFSKEH